MIGVKSFVRRAPKLCNFATARKASSLIVAEHDGSSVSPSTLSVITAASKIGGDISVLVAGKGVDAAAQHAASVENVTKVIVMDNADLEHCLAEDMTSILTQIAGNYSHVLAASSNTGKNFMPRVAAMMDCSPVMDVLSVVSESTFTRPMYAGNAIATVECTNSTKFLVVRPTAFDKAAVGSSPTAPVEALQVADGFQKSSLSSFVSQSTSASERPDLTAASVVISGGRGMKNGENFAMLETMADKLGGAVGASRAAVDAGYVPNEYQVGQTGKVVAPDLYVAVGISGAIQHLSGMKDSKTIVAINKDKEAPIFQVADYGLVEDLFKAVPEMNEKL